MKKSKQLASDQYLNHLSDVEGRLQRLFPPTVRTTGDKMYIGRSDREQAIFDVLASLRSRYIEEHYPELIEDMFYSGGKL